MIWDWGVCVYWEKRGGLYHWLSGNVAFGIEEGDDVVDAYEAVHFRFLVYIGTDWNGFWSSHYRLQYIYTDKENSKGCL